MTIKETRKSLCGLREKTMVCEMNRMYPINVIHDEKGVLLVFFKPVSSDEGYLMFMRRNQNAVELRQMYELEIAKKLTKEEINKIKSVNDLSGRLWGYSEFSWEL